MSNAVPLENSARSANEEATCMHHRFNAWAIAYGKEYYDPQEDSRGAQMIGVLESSAEEPVISEYSKRKAIFAGNYRRISEMESSMAQSAENAWKPSYDGPFMDLTGDEFERLLLGYRPSSDDVFREYAHGPAEGPELNRNVYVDWRDHGAITEVKNQRQCGSCWAFSTTGSVEGAHYLATGELLSLSEQELVECDRVDQGCGGGLMDNAFKFIMRNDGIDTEEDWPYTSGLGGPVPKCNTTKATARRRVTIDGYNDVFPNETALQKAVVEQPVSVAVDARLWQFYGSGVFNGLFGMCGEQLNHGVLLVGYNRAPLDNTTRPYYVVKNSWGPEWGEGGYIRLAMDRDVYQYGLCGIAKAASYPFIDDKILTAPAKAYS